MSDILLLVLLLLLLGWGGGLTFGVGPLIHLLLVFALIVFVVRLVTGRTPL